MDIIKGMRDSMIFTSAKFTSARRIAPPYTHHIKGIKDPDTTNQVGTRTFSIISSSLLYKMASKTSRASTFQEGVMSLWLQHHYVNDFKAFPINKWPQGLSKDVYPQLHHVHMCKDTCKDISTMCRDVMSSTTIFVFFIESLSKSFTEFAMSSTTINKHNLCHQW